MIDNNTLLCPSCGGDNTHHYYVEVFDRKVEDSGLEDVVSVFTPCDHESKIPLIGEGNHKGFRCDIRSDGALSNPSLRRNGVNIWFWCECCGCTSVLSLAQHKGSTLVSVEPIRDGVVENVYKKEEPPRTELSDIEEDVAAVKENPFAVDFC